MKCTSYRPKHHQWKVRSFLLYIHSLCLTIDGGEYINDPQLDQIRRTQTWSDRGKIISLHTYTHSVGQSVLFSYYNGGAYIKDPSSVKGKFIRTLTLLDNHYFSLYYDVGEYIKDSQSYLINRSTWKFQTISLNLPICVYHIT